MATSRSRTEPSKRRALGHWWLIVAVLFVAVGVLFAWRAQMLKPSLELSSAAVAPPVVRRETRPTLDPALFVGKARLAHQIAREIPDVLDQLYCYCECDKHAGHKSLLSCYTDGHAAT